MAFLDKVLGRDEREEQLKKEIRSLELRKESVFSSINGEIARLQAERRNILLEAGTSAYEVWCKDKTQANLVEYWNKIVELEKLINEQEAKKTEMGNRYDEEISLIRSTFGVANVTVEMQSTAADAGKCPNCNAPISAEDVFCTGCGTKLQ